MDRTKGYSYWITKFGKKSSVKVTPRFGLIMILGKYKSIPLCRRLNLKRFIVAGVTTFILFFMLSITGDVVAPSNVSPRKWSEDENVTTIQIPVDEPWPNPPFAVNSSQSHRNINVNLCPFTQADLGLKGPITVNHTVPTWRHLEMVNNDVGIGGSWHPTDCVARHNVAIVIPYRNRQRQFMQFLQHMHPFLKKQKIAYTIYLIEQVPGKVFNRGLMRNIGYTEALKQDPSHECTIFHDVDLLPLDERNLYTCPDQPRHVCVEVDYINNFMPLYQNGYAVFGGVTSFRRDHFKDVNGYSNLYLSWGAEDDDMHRRIAAKEMHVLRIQDNISKYHGIPHPDESTLPKPHSKAENVSRFKLLNLATQRIDRDGLNDLRYTVKSVVKRKLFTHITVDVEEDWYAFQAIEEEKAYPRSFSKVLLDWKNHLFSIL